MSLRTAAQLLFLISVSTLLAAVANIGGGRIVWVSLTVVSHVALVFVGSRVLTTSRQ